MWTHTLGQQRPDRGLCGDDDGLVLKGRQLIDVPGERRPRGDEYGGIPGEAMSQEIGRGG